MERCNKYGLPSAANRQRSQKIDGEYFEARAPLAGGSGWLREKQNSKKKELSCLKAMQTVKNRRDRLKTEDVIAITPANSRVHWQKILPMNKSLSPSRSLMVTGQALIIATVSGLH